MTQNIYIVASREDAKKSLFGVATSNEADNVLVLKSFEVKDVDEVMEKIHTTLRGLCCKNRVNIYRCPFKLFAKLIEYIIEDNRGIDFFSNIIVVLRADNIWTYGITNEEFLAIDKKYNSTTKN